ncbi:carbohydrate ABC transporter, N-acetylglucosamine/diacetylchitobiose-binding protein [Tessaracoccus sp. MC1865]|uniref:N-acetylglucosamine/diacetylchitobiose ABC transporter substrate-binding protein n=1 Tax=Tessaracoccus sp. MC1865 TaxID=2760310 RepID=UPI001602D6FE|nr:N-acetylglucosamine/diacetylchitobiose ABC transporter substrate-binding protein [Tessaracoccus sp. MC1865]MBB1482750.1 carbohydrate ABC transporter, N-acetylglucosamine/diacetylchitobiose-binding protein [Tessaracoccus sp. MC1865]QTO37803.1 N-acetylglucosamine/diacetylchitobiose ABC transporter substrate-binding protein [Tessaracoccus sp. MC1865]
MTILGRRHFLAAAAVVPLTACVNTQPPAPPGESQTGSPTSTPEPSPTATHPFGLTVPSSVKAVIFDGAFGVGYVRDAATAMRKTYEGLRVQVSASSDITADVAPLFADGATPPDLVDNSGSHQLAVADIVDELLPLDDLMSSVNLEGIPIEETLYSGVVQAGTFNGRHVALDYALSVYGLWHSASHFAAQGWAVPTAWDELLELGEQARGLGQDLFVWGDDAASYYAELAISSAIKEGGHDVRRALDNLEPEGWSHPAVAGVLQSLAECVAAGFVRHGGAYVDAQAEWSQHQKALFYPSGSWIAREMEGRTSHGFEMTVSPVPALTAAPTLPWSAAHAQPIEQFMVPKNSANPAGGQELLRTLLSREAAESFARNNLVPTVVRTTVPADLESTALAAQTRLLADAGEDVYSWRFVSHYGLSEDYNRLWGQFLRGDLGAQALAEELQALSDAVREDPDIPTYTVD